MQDESLIPEIAFCEKWCGELSPPQKVLVVMHKRRGSFLGVSRALGSSVLYPLITLDGKGDTVNVVDKAGYYQLAAMDGRRGFKTEEAE